MSRKVCVKVKVTLAINVEEGVDIGEVLSEMDYNFTSRTDNAEVVEYVDCSAAIVDCPI